MEKSDERNIVADEGGKEVWIKPEVVSFAPAKAAEGISYQPGDGIYNLTP